MQITISNSSSTFFIRYISPVYILSDIVSLFKSMAPTAASIWDWALAVLPVTALVTFLVTLVSSNLASNDIPRGGSLLQISQLGSGASYVYFIVGFSLLFPQILAIIIGRLLFLLQTQNMINRVVLYIGHIIILIPFIFMLIVAFVSGNSRSDAHRHALYGIFESIALYCVLHTIAVFYLYQRRANGAQYSKVTLPIWFLVCSLLFLAFFIVWVKTNGVILGYIAAIIPFLYFLGFVPQFWASARSRKRYNAVSKVGKALDSLTGGK